MYVNGLLIIFNNINGENNCISRHKFSASTMNSLIYQMWERQIGLVAGGFILWEITLNLCNDKLCHTNETRHQMIADRVKMTLPSKVQEFVGLESLWSQFGCVTRDLGSHVLITNIIMTGDNKLVFSLTLGWTFMRCLSRKSTDCSKLCMLSHSNQLQLIGKLMNRVELSF